MSCLFVLDMCVSVPKDSIFLQGRVMFVQWNDKCSFENAAKGNVIFDSLDVCNCAAHGAVSFGGRESVVLEFAT